MVTFDKQYDGVLKSQYMYHVFDFTDVVKCKMLQDTCNGLYWIYYRIVDGELYASMSLFDLVKKTGGAEANPVFMESFQGVTEYLVSPKLNATPAAGVQRLCPDQTVSVNEAVTGALVPTHSDLDRYEREMIASINMVMEREYNLGCPIMMEVGGRDSRVYMMWPKPKKSIIVVSADPAYPGVEKLISDNKWMFEGVDLYHMPTYVPIDKAEHKKLLYTLGGMTAPRAQVLMNWIREHVKYDQGNTVCFNGVPGAFLGNLDPRYPRQPRGGNLAFWQAVYNIQYKIESSITVYMREHAGLFCCAPMLDELSTIPIRSFDHSSVTYDFRREIVEKAWFAEEVKPNLSGWDDSATGGPPGHQFSLKEELVMLGELFDEFDLR